MIDFTLSLPNIQYAADASDATALDIRLDACVYDDLSCDLIIGLPIIGDWLHRIEWDDWGTEHETRNVLGNGTKLHLMDEDDEPSSRLVGMMLF